MLLTDWRGLPVGYTIVPANEREYEPVRTLALGDGSPLLVADKGLWGAAYAENLALEGVTIRTPDRVRTSDNLASERTLASFRLVIESTIANLKCQMRLKKHLAKTPPGLAACIAARSCSRGRRGRARVARYYATAAGPALLGEEEPELPVLV